MKTHEKLDVFRMLLKAKLTVMLIYKLLNQKKTNPFVIQLLEGFCILMFLVFSYT